MPTHPMRDSVKSRLAGALRRPRTSIGLFLSVVYLIDLALHYRGLDNFLDASGFTGTLPKLAVCLSPLVLIAVSLWMTHRRAGATASNNRIERREP